MTTDITIPADRPRPLREAADDVARFHALWAAAGTAIVSGGLISAATTNLITALLGLVPGALALIATIVGAKQVARTGEQLVTPVSEPRNNAGQRLVPAPEPPVLPIDSMGPIG